MSEEKRSWFSPATWLHPLLKYPLRTESPSLTDLLPSQLFKKTELNIPQSYPPLKPSLHAGWVQHIQQAHVPIDLDHTGHDGESPIKETKEVSPISTDKTTPKQREHSVICHDTPPIRICIIGAGISGLYLAMMLEDLGIPELSYDILESRNRIGGRVYTHHFGDERKSYYDVGAMRFPKIPPLARTFELFSRCGADVVPYTYDNSECPKLYNGLRVPSDNSHEKNKDPFLFGISQGGIVPDEVVSQSPDAVLQRAFEPFIARLAKDFSTGFEYLMKFDHLTTREYLAQEMKLDFSSIWYLETVCSASGLYDKAFSEAVLDAMEFHYPTATGSPPKWYRVAGGTSQVVQRIAAGLSCQPLLEHRVTSVVYETAQCDYPMFVQVDGEDQPRRYSTVFSTVPLPCLRRMHLGPGTLSSQQRAAIQSVHYDDSTKIAIRFRTAWWRTICSIYGGQATTDLPIRTCVYPSDDSTVLLCSYTWGQDAHQMGSLLNHGFKSAQRHLEQLILDNLALLHQDHPDKSIGPAYGYARMRQLLDEEFEEIHGHHWGGDPDSSGAFAYFGPGQFRTFYPGLVEPAANGRMFLVGEACSFHHGWIAGALESSYRAISQYLSLPQCSSKADAVYLDKAQQTLRSKKVYLQRSRL